MLTTNFTMLYHQLNFFLLRDNYCLIAMKYIDIASTCIKRFSKLTVINLE